MCPPTSSTSAFTRSSATTSRLDVKPYTYNYDNSEKYSNAVPITDNPALIGTTYAPLGVTITALCNQLVTKKGSLRSPAR